MMKIFFKASTNIVKSLFNTIVNLVLASENLSKALLIRSEIENIKLQSTILENIDDSELFLDKIQSKHDAMRRKSIPILITFAFMALILILIF